MASSIVAGSVQSSYQVSDIARLGAGHGLFHSSTCGQVTAGAGMQINVGAIPAGAAIVNGTVLGAVSAATPTVSANASGNPRRDVVVVNTSGTVSIIAGTAAAAPARATMAATDLVLAEIAVANGAASIVAGNITDQRVTLAMPRLVKKTADETVNNSSSEQNDDHLFFSIFPNEVWQFDTYMFFSATNATAGVKFQYTQPAGSTYNMHYQLMTGNTMGLFGFVNAEVVANGTAWTGVHHHGIVINSSTAGTFQLQWAQGAATVANTTLNGSVQGPTFLIARRVL